MSYYNYILEPYLGLKSRHRCVQCGKRELSLYINSESREYLGDHVGRCNREMSCGYHYTPKEYFAANGIKPVITEHKKQREAIVKPSSFIEKKTFFGSLKAYDKNNFIIFLITLLGQDVAKKLIETYFIGTAVNGKTVYWQLDISGNVRTGKIMMYNPETGKRVKTNYSRINWVHSKIENFNLSQCLFGEHLLIDSRKPIGIVESEKTAIIASAYLPQYTWLATGGLNNLKVEKCQSLKGRKVILYPDLGGFEKWSKKAEELKEICTVEISDLLEKNASEEARLKGFDLADYLIRFTPEQFKKRKKYEELSKQERLQIGLSIFSEEDLREFGHRLFSSSLEIYYSPLIDCINILEGLHNQDAEDLLDILCIRKILKVTDYGYTLNLKQKQCNKNNLTQTTQ